MNTNTLKLFAGNVIVQSDMPKEAKLQLMNFVENASEQQVKAFLMDAELIPHTEDVVVREIIDIRFNVSGLIERVNEFEEDLLEAGGRVAKLRKTAMSLSGATGVYTTIPWLAYRKIRSMNDDCTRRCGTYELNTARRQHCMIKCKVQKYEARLKAAEGVKNKTEIEKAKAALMKAKAELMKSKGSFKVRGADEQQ